MNKTEIPHKCNRCSAILWFSDKNKNYVYDDKTVSYRCIGCYELWGLRK